MADKTPDPLLDASEPRIFGWLLTMEPRLRSDSSRNCHGKLLADECQVLCSAFLDHVIAKLKSYRYGFSVSESCLTEMQVDELKHAPIRAYSEADIKKAVEMRALGGAEMARISDSLVETLTADQKRFFPRHPGQFKFKDVFVRAPDAACYFWDRLIRQWQSMSPTKKFFLLGGHTVLTRMFAGKIPDKLIYYAIFHLCIRGTATSDQIDIFSGVGCAIPNEHQTKAARSFVRTIPSVLSIRPAGAKSEYLTPLVGGLQEQISGRGRSAGSRAWAQAQRRRRLKRKGK